MTTPKTFDRKTFLTSTVAAWAAVTLNACSDDESGGGTGGTGGTATGGTGVGGSGTAGSGMAGGGSGGTPAAGAGGTPGAGMAGSSTAGGGTGGGGMGGGGGTTVCTTMVGGDHTHPLTVPGSDIDQGFQDAPYVLQDGGTGHTHTLELSAYEFFYLDSGEMVTVESSTDNAHSHMCVIGCTTT